MVEYALLVALVALIGSASIEVFGQAVNTKFIQASDAVGGGNGTGCSDPKSSDCYAGIHVGAGSL